MNPTKPIIKTTTKILIITISISTPLKVITFNRLVKQSPLPDQQAAHDCYPRFGHIDPHRTIEPTILAVCFACTSGAELSGQTRSVLHRIYHYPIRLFSVYAASLGISTYSRFGVYGNVMSTALPLRVTQLPSGYLKMRPSLS